MSLYEEMKTSLKTNLLLTFLLLSYSCYTTAIIPRIARATIPRIARAWPYIGPILADINMNPHKFVDRAINVHQFANDKYRDFSNKMYIDNQRRNMDMINQARGMSMFDRMQIRH